ncbi:hypothetical protein THIOSC13_220052 [uncultured Thiomicrorhabdus sp.]
MFFMLGIREAQNKVPIDFSEEFEEINSRQRLRSIALAMVENANNEVTLPNLARRGFAKFG